MKIINAWKSRPDIVVLLVCALALLVFTGAQAILLPNQNSNHFSTATGFISLSIPWISFILTFVIVVIGFKLFLSVNSLSKKLHGILEENDYGNRIDPQVHLSYKNLIDEINELLVHVEYNSKRVGDMAEVIDQREQENQLLWLEIEHNLCMAKEEAETDGLTQLYNRKSIEERFSMELEKAIDNNKPISVLMADLDHFKRVNDTFGHKAGDEVLKIFAETLKESTRSDDISARYGGEEFIIVLPEAPAAAAIRIAERINIAFEKAVVKNLASSYDGLKCTVSIGVADYPNCADEKGKLVSAADIALYRAKEDGRNCVVYYSDIHEESSKSISA